MTTIRFTVRALILASCCAAAHAQEQAPQRDSAGPPPLLLEEIVVTARKRYENLQDVPLSAHVVSGPQMVESNLTSLQDVAATLPSIHVAQSGSGGQLFVRGIGSGSNVSFDPSVGLFVDDIYKARGHFNGDTTFDLDRIEVLNGPQSTFFGNNAIAGALNIRTARPLTEEFDFTGRALYGEFGQYTSETAINVPVGDSFAVRLAGMANGINGWQSNPYAGETQPHERNQAGRIALRWHTDLLDINGKFETQNNVSHDGSVITDCPPASPFVPAGFCGAALAHGLPTGIGSRTNTTLGGQGTDFNTQDGAVTIEYLLGRNTLTSVTGYYQFQFRQHADASGLPQDAFNISIQEGYSQFSQEIRITSPSSQPVQYLAGVYAQVDRDSGRPSDISYFFLTPTIQRIPALAPLLPYLPLGNTDELDQQEHSYAAFGSLTWRISDDWTVTASARETNVYKTAEGPPSQYGQATQPFGGIVPLPANLQPLAGAVLGLPNTTNESRSYNGFTPSGTVEYHVTPSKMAYVRYDQGFLAGIPLQVNNPGIPSAPVKSEHVNSYEVGWKSEWLDGRVRGNLDYFHSAYRDLQVVSGFFDAQGNLVTQVTNAARVLSQGIEGLLEWSVNRHLTLTADTTYLRSRYTDYRNVSQTQLQAYCHANVGLCVAQFGGNGDPGSLQDLTGKPTSFSPKLSGSLTAAYRQDIGAWRAMAKVLAYGSTWYYDGNVGLDDPLAIQPGYVRLDALLSLETPHHWEFDLIGRNLTSRLVTAGGTGATGLPLSAGSLLVQEQEPRNVSFQVRFHF